MTNSHPGTISANNAMMPTVDCKQRPQKNRRHPHHGETKHTRAMFKSKNTTKIVKQREEASTHGGPSGGKSDGFRLGDHPYNRMRRIYQPQSKRRQQGVLLGRIYSISRAVLLRQETIQNFCGVLANSQNLSTHTTTTIFMPSIKNIYEER